MALCNLCIHPNRVVYTGGRMAPGTTIKSPGKIKALLSYGNVMNSSGNIGKHLNFKAFASFIVKYSGYIRQKISYPLTSL